MTKYYLQHPLNPAIFVEVPRKPEEPKLKRKVIGGESFYQRDEQWAVQPLIDFLNQSKDRGYDCYDLDYNTVETWRFETEEETESRIEQEVKVMQEYEMVIQERKGLLEKLYQESLEA